MGGRENVDRTKGTEVHTDRQERRGKQRERETHTHTDR